MIHVQDNTPSFSKQVSSNGATFYVKDRFTHAKSVFDDKSDHSSNNNVK